MPLYNLTEAQNCILLEPGFNEIIIDTVYAKTRAAVKDDNDNIQHIDVTTGAGASDPAIAADVIAVIQTIENPGPKPVETNVITGIVGNTLGSF